MNLQNFVKYFSPNDYGAWETYDCARCGSKVSGFVVAITDSSISLPCKWLLCPTCLTGSVKIAYSVYPGAAAGSYIEGLPSDVEKAYEEVRQCMTIEAFTSSELMCRKILMYVAVDKGAEEGKTFQFYLGYLEKLGYITPPMKGWLDLIRTHGNDATHKIDTPDKKRAESTFMFTATLLTVVYQMEHIAKKFKPPSN